MVGRTTGDCSTLRSFDGAEAAKGEAATRLTDRKTSEGGGKGGGSFYLMVFFGVVGLLPYVISSIFRASFCFCCA